MATPNDMQLCAAMARVLVDGNVVTPGQALALAGLSNRIGMRARRALDALVDAGVAERRHAGAGVHHWSMRSVADTEAA